MSRQHHYRRRTREPAELDMTTFLNLMVVLVPFLLITVVELSLPSSNSGAPPVDPGFRVEVIVRDQGLEITNGKTVIAAIPNVDDEYDMATLSEYLMSLKRDYPEKDDASVLLEPDIPYNYLIEVMDVVRSAELPGEGEEEPVRVALFTDISIGDAP
jgi:biopolymer transport protein ExbD